MTASTANRAPEDSGPKPRTSRIPTNLSIGKVLLEGRAFLALIVIIVVFSSLSGNYFTVDNIISMASHVAIYALLAMGMLLVILNGGIDLSVGSTLAISGMVAGFLMKGVNLPLSDHTAFPAVWVVVVICCAVGGFVGLVNGILVGRLKVAPFVATLGTLYVVRGLAELMTNGQPYNNLAGDPKLGNTGFNWLGFNKLLGIPVGVIVMVVVAIIIAVTLNRAVFGRWLYASGGNERAAELSGVPVRKVKVRVYVASGVCAAIAGLILSSELTAASPVNGQSYELTAIAAVVIGGAALTGGRGNVRGTLLGAFVIGFLSDGLTIVGVSSYWQTVFTGAVIILAVLLNAVQYKGTRRRKTGSSAPGADGATADAAGPRATKNSDVPQSAPDIGKTAS
ncbi:ABC transporter permease [Allobranchiibius sp. CTAmp26]|uniref:ABC transporter permease n=1 Tax=Allobranchiibius sp. CTAmp26 TaxID=2815214 RepID=UPI001AA13B2D|nr:ABC transporter permease [Allobranchiibius sp. CTAmp26]MBO1756792.1 ABC transporter permease [Allobranchiibius sp. CTAmp26]